MKRIILSSVFCLLSSLLPLFQAAYASSISSDELIGRARELDGKWVIYRAEAVKAILVRGKHSWVNLNDGSNAIGVWCPAKDSRAIRFLGDYKTRGDIVEVEGIFNRACRVHGGELDIHGHRVRIVKDGCQVPEVLDERISYLTVVLFMLTAFLVIRYKRRI